MSAGLSARAVLGVALRPSAESVSFNRARMSVLSVVCCQVQVSATS